VDWRFCVTGDPEIDYEVPGTHVGLVFNPGVYRVLAERLYRDSHPRANATELTSSERVRKPA
jgi:hypothetical protein